MRSLALALASVLFVLVAQGRAPAQAPYGEQDDFWRGTSVHPDLASRLLTGAEAPPVPSSQRSPHIQMFGMLPGFLSEPVGSGDDPTDNTGDYFEGGVAAASGLSGVVLSVDNYNPYFDLKRPGSPITVGYVRVHSQVQLVDSGGTSVSLGMRAYMPAGPETVGGLVDGPTTFSPGLGIFQDIGNGAALHGYVGQNFRGGVGKDGPLQYGMAVHCPLMPWVDDDDCGVYLFMQALGTYAYASDRQGRSMNWEVMPGVHWRMSDNCWLSFGGSRSSMLTWMWQY